MSNGVNFRELALDLRRQLTEVQDELAATKAQADKPNHANQMAKRWGSIMPKAQGVVQWPEADEIMQMAFEEGQPADDASGYCFELEEFDLFIERLMSEVARINAAPAAPARRNKMDSAASLLARAASILVKEGFSALPAEIYKHLENYYERSETPPVAPEATPRSRLEREGNQ